MCFNHKIQTSKEADIKKVLAKNAKLGFSTKRIVSPSKKITFGI